MQIRFFTPESYRKNIDSVIVKEQPDYENTVSITSKKMCYISKSTLKDKGVPQIAAAISASTFNCFEITLEFLSSTVNTEEYVRKIYKLSPKYSTNKYVRGYGISFSSVLTNMGILKVQKLIRLPYYWKGDLMVINAESLRGSN